MWAIIMTGRPTLELFNRATSAARPGAGSRSVVWMPAPRRTSSRYRATPSSRPGGFTVSMRMSAWRCAMHSQSAPSQSIASATLPVCVVNGELRQWLNCAPNGTSSFPYAAGEAGTSGNPAADELAQAVGGYTFLNQRIAVSHRDRLVLDGLPVNRQ